VGKKKRRSHNGEPRGVHVNGVFYEGLKRDSRGIYVYDPTAARKKKGQRGGNIIRFGNDDTPDKARRVEAKILKWKREQAQREGRGLAFESTMSLSLPAGRVIEPPSTEELHSLSQTFGDGEEIAKRIEEGQHRLDAALTQEGFSAEEARRFKQGLSEDPRFVMELAWLSSTEFWLKVGDAVRREPATWSRRLGLPELKGLPYVEVQPDVSLDIIRDRYVKRVPSLSAKEQTEITHAWKVFADAVQVETIAEVDKEAIQRFVEEIDRRIGAREWTSWKGTVSKALIRIRSVLRASAEDDNPADHCRRVLGMISNRKLRAAAFEAECAKRGEKTKPKRPITPEEFQGLLKAAKGDRFLTCAVLLGANCGFTQMSLVGCWRESMHLEAEIPYHDFHRVKRQVVKRIAPLWVETRNALRAYLTQDHDPKVVKGDKILMFSHDGQPWKPHELKDELESLVDKAGVDPGLLWSWWRHTCETVPRDEAPKQGVAIDQFHLNMVMGHTLPQVKQHYYLEGAEPLTYITDYLHEYYYSTSKKRKGKAKQQERKKTKRKKKGKKEADRKA